jgi:hypothetical protein
MAKINALATLMALHFIFRLSGEHGRWSTRECVRTFENQTHIKCACYHFTNFAVLFKITDGQV